MRRARILGLAIPAICCVFATPQLLAQSQATPMQQVGQRGQGATSQTSARQNAGETPALQTRTTAAALKTPPRRAGAALHENLKTAAQEANQQSQATPMQAAGQQAQNATAEERDQGQQAKVTLVVRDQSGATVSNADVEIEPVGISLRTNGDGTVSFGVPLGRYDLIVGRPGFEAAKEHVDVRDTTAHTLNVALRIGVADRVIGGVSGTPVSVGAAKLPTEFHPPMVPRKVAVTFDDLPAFESGALNGTQIDAQNERLLGTLRREKIPAIGFVNEVKLYQWGQVDERIKALQMWLDDGFELGNHTYSHVSLNKVGLQAWEENVVEGEPVLKLLLAQHHMTLRYFRHPFLDTGPDLLTRREADAFLSSRGYTVAPVTIDVGDWEFAPVYYDAKRKGDTAEENRVVDAFLDYANESLDYAERFSKQIIGYEPMQVILLHDSQLEADHFADLTAVMRKRNYSFITLDEALEDSAYNLPNNYAGGGTGWLDQWAITEGKMPPNEPQLPAWIEQRLAALH
ncbi:MAG TPA: polysaccharide deacetylase family protein [Candidatus Acidoferrum sp.]|nr:polysaccharide deacetylase family protein [Candidatus Acidoferrum sp.]